MSSESNGKINNVSIIIDDNLWNGEIGDSIRKKFAASIGENAVHGSDSDENAAIEGSFFFSALEKF